MGNVRFGQREEKIEHCSLVECIYYSIWGIPGAPTSRYARSYPDIVRYIEK